MAKPIVKLGGVPLAASSSITWAFTIGVQPYITTFQVHKSDFGRIERMFGKKNDLLIVDSRGVRIYVRDVVPLHEVASDSPNRRAFMVADKRWLWQYKIVVRDFNVSATTGTQLSLYDVPYPGSVTADQYIYKNYSIKEGTKYWTARELLENVLEEIEPDGYDLRDFPIRDNELGDFSVQGLTLYDSADVALSRCLAMMGGVDIYITPGGKVKVLNAADLAAAKSHLSALPPTRWDGDYPREIKRSGIRPGRIIVYYVRQVEILWEFDQDVETLSRATGEQFEPFLENVCPTVDPETTVNVYDPIRGQTLTAEGVAPGTYVRLDDWLRAMNMDRPMDSMPWTWDTIKSQWVAGDLHGVLGARALATSSDENLSARVNNLLQHFRQTFRANRRYMDRIQELLPIRAGLLDPFSGARQPASVWGQGTTIPTEKGKRMSHRDDLAKSYIYRSENYLRPHLTGGEPLIKTAFGPQQVVMINRDAGIFHTAWNVDPYGNIGAWIPSLLENDKSVHRNMGAQDGAPMGVNMRREGTDNGIFLSAQNKLRTIMTMVPGAPNNKTRLQPVVIWPGMVKPIYRERFAIEGGDGPDLEVFVSPGECTTRFAWGVDDEKCKDTIKKLLGVMESDPNKAGIEPGIRGQLVAPEFDLPGFTLINYEKEVFPHAKAVAAEMWASYADSVQGRVATALPKRGGLSLAGNMSDVSIHVSSAPSGKVTALHGFTGRQRHIPRHAMLDNESRRQLLGIIAFRREV